MSDNAGLFNSNRNTKPHTPQSWVLEIFLAATALLQLVARPEYSHFPHRLARALPVISCFPAVPGICILFKKRRKHLNCLVK